MEKPGMFRQTPGVVRRGITERAENPDPSPVVPGIERPVWRSFVGNEAFQKVNAPLVKDEQRRMAEAARPDPRPRVSAERVPKWKSGIGTLQVERPDGVIEDYDPESLLDDPEVGNLAAESLWKRDMKAAADERDALKFRLTDPSDTRRMTAKEREDALLNGGSLAETDPRHVSLKKRLMEDEARTADEQAAYDADARVRKLTAGGVAAWRAGREAARSVGERSGRIAARELEIDAAEESAVAEERALDEKMRRGVSGAEVGAIQARKAEIAAARQGMEAARAEVGTERQGVAAAARREADGMDGKPSVPASEKMASALQAAGLFGSATSAMSGALNKGISRRVDGDWDLPQMVRSSGGWADGIKGGLAMIDQKTGMRLGEGASKLDETKAIQKVFHDFQQAEGLSDDEVIAAWNDLGVINRKFEEGEKARVTSQGQLVPNAGDSDWLDTAKAAAIIEGSAASPESKAATLANLPAIQEQIAKSKAAAYDEASRSGVFGAPGLNFEKIPLFADFAKQHGGTPVEQVKAYEERYLNRRLGIQKQLSEWMAAGQAGIRKADQMIFGLMAMTADAATKDERLARDAAAFNGGKVESSMGLKAADFLRGEASGLAKSSSLLKQGAGVDGLISSLIEEVPSLAIQIGLTRFAGAAGTAVSGSSGVGRATGLLASFTAAGGQSAGITYAQQIAAGDTPEEANVKARKAGLNTAIITGVFSSVGLGGMESIAAGGAARMTLGNFLAFSKKKGIANVAASKEFRQFVGSVLKSAGGEASEEGIDELTAAFLTADPDENLADAWSNAVEAAKIGGFIGGAVDLAAGAKSPRPVLADGEGAPAGGGTSDADWHAAERARMDNEDWLAQTVESTPEERALRVNFEMTAVNPSAAPATPEEVAAAEELVGPFGAGPDAQALEEQIAAASPEEAAALRDKRGRTSAEEVAAGIEIVREIAAEEEQVEEVVAEAEAGLAEAMALGDPVALEQATAGVAVARAGRSKPARARGVLKIARGETLETLTAAEVRSLGITREGKPMKEEELAAVGLAAPAVEVLADGSLIVLDEALAELSPAARKRVKMNEAQARKKAVERAAAAAPTPTPAKKKGKIQLTPEERRAYDAGVLPPPPDLSPEEQKAWVDERIAAQAPAAGQKFTVTGRAGTVVEVEAADEQAAQIAGADALSLGETVASVAPVGGAAPAPAPKIAADSPFAPITKRLEKLQAALGESLVVTEDPGERAEIRQGKIYINLPRLVGEAVSGGLSNKEASAWIDKVIDEEVRHLAHQRALVLLWQESGSTEPFGAWYKEYGTRGWKTEFLAKGKAAMVRDIYGKESFATLSPEEKYMEGVRIMSQSLATGSPTEIAKLWQNSGAQVIETIRAALRVLKEMVANLSPALKAEIAAIEAQLSKYEQNTGTVPDRGEKPAEVRETGGDVPGGGKGSDNQTPGGRPSDAGAGGEVLPAGKGSRVSFTRGGERRSGVVVAVATNGTLLVNLDGGGRLTVSQDEVEVAPVAKTSPGVPPEIARMRALGESNRSIRDAEGEVDRAATKAQTARRAAEAGMSPDEFSDAQAAENRAAIAGFYESLEDGDVVTWVDGNGRTNTATVRVYSDGSKVVRSTDEDTDYVYPPNSTAFINNAASLTVTKRSDKATALDSPADATPAGSEPAAGSLSIPVEQMTPAQFVAEYRRDRPNSKETDDAIRNRHVKFITTAIVGSDADGRGPRSFSAEAAAAYGITIPSGWITKEGLVSPPMTKGEPAAGDTAAADGAAEEIEFEIQPLRPGAPKETLKVPANPNAKKPKEPAPTPAGDTSAAAGDAPSDWTPDRQAEYKKLKAALNKAIKSGDKAKIIAEAQRGLARFETIGFPDDWSRWERVRDDASRPEFVEPVTKPLATANPDLEQLSKDRAKIIAAVAAVPAVVNAIRNTPHNAPLTAAEEVRRILVDLFNAGDLSVASYDYFAKNVEKAEWVKTVVRDVEKGMAPTPAPAATGMIHAEGGKFYADTRAMNGINGIPGLKHDHVGFGDFETITPRGKVNWFRRDDMTVEGMTGRVHELSGTPEAVASLVESLKTAGVAESAPAAPKVTVAPKPVRSAADQALIDAMSDLVDGLEAAPLAETFTRAIPPAKIGALIDVAQKYIAEGITTPEAFGARLATLAGGKLKPYSQGLWGAFMIVDPTVNGKPDWAAIYGGIDNTPAEADIQNEDEQAQRDGDSGSPVNDGAEGTAPRTGEDSQPGMVDGGGRGDRPEGVRPGQPDGDGRSELPGGSVPGSDVDAPGGEGNDGTPAGDRGGRGDAGRAGVRDGSRPDVGSPEANFVIEDGFSMPRGEKARIDANIKAIGLLREIESKGRNATAAEKKTLAKYSGWGSFKNAFNRINQGKWVDINERINSTSSYYQETIRSSEAYQELKAWRDKWGELHDQLAGMLSADEFRAMSKSIRNAHYTALPIIDSMWSMVRAMGFKGGKVLETSAGAGYFVGRQPGDMANVSQWSAVELDSITARIFSKLYPESRINGNAPDPSRSVDGQGFQKSKIPNNSIDLVIGNFPFAQDGPSESIKEFGKKLNLHNYFFARSIDKLKPGGIIVAITSNSTMDNNIVQRELLAGRVELVKAIRLPNDAFKENAGTEVTTDILILRKKDGSRDAESKSWINTESVGDDTVYAKQAGKPVYEFLSSLPAEWVPVDEELQEPWKEWRARRPKTGDKWKDLTNAITRRRYSASEGIPFRAPMVVNEYFARNPETVIGKHALEGSMYRAGSYAVVSNGVDVQARLNAITESLPSGLFGEPETDTDAGPETMEAGDQHREGSIVLENGQPYHVVGGQLVPVRWDMEYAEDTLLDNKDVKDALRGNPELSEEVRSKFDGLSGKPLSDWLNGFLDEHLSADAAQKIRDKIKKETDRRNKVFASWTTVRGAARSLMNAELRGDPAGELYRQALNQAYDAHVRLHGAFSARNRPGTPNPHRFLFDEDDSPLLESLEDEILTGTDEKGRPIYRYEKRPIFTESMISSAAAPTAAQDIKDAVGISMGYKGRISIRYMAELLKVSEQDAESQLAKSGLAFKNPKSGLYETSDTYLSGEVRAKLREAMEADALEPGSFTANIEALKAIEPETRPIQSISIILGARWIPGSVYQKFGEEMLGMDTPVIRYEQAANIWRIETAGEKKRRNARNRGGSEASRANDPDYLGTASMSAEEIFEAILNSREIRVTMPGPTRGSTVLDPEATIEAQTKASQMIDKFAEWTKTTKAEVEHEGRDVRIGALVEQEFNDKVAGLVTPTFTGDWVTLPGQSGEIWLKPHRKAVLARLLTMGYGMMAHGVGSGKTYNQIALAMELRRLGKARRPVTIVQNSTIRQFAASHMKAYPHAKILVADESNFSARKRARFLAKIATGDYDSIIMTHSNISQIGHDEQAIRNYMARAIGELEEILASAESGSQEQADIQAALDKLQEKLEKMLAKAMSRAGSILTWEQLGVDALIVDEAHEFKNAPIITRKQRVKNLPSGEASDRAVMMQIKTASVQAITGGKNVFFATGTPITNTMAEAYTMLNFIAPTLMESKGIKNFDDFATMFGRTVTEPEATWRGEIELVERFAKFVNGPELVALIRSVFDVALGNETMGIRVPHMKGGGPEMLIIEPTEASEIFNDWVIDTAAEFDGIQNKRRTFEENPWMQAIPIMIMQAGMAQAIDPRLINPNAPDDPNSKVNQMIGRIVEIYEAGTARKTAQVVFTDLSNPFSTLLLKQFNGDPFAEYGETSPEMAALEQQIMDAPKETDAEKSAKKRLVARYNKLVEGRFSLMDDIKKKLVARNIPASEILLAESSLDKKKLQASFDKVNSGEIRVIIGSTARLGVGVNIQERLAAAHNLSPPRDFKPAMMEQRIGRIERQGNLHRDWADQAFIDVVEKLSKQKFDAKKLEARYEQAVEWLEANGNEGMKAIARKAEAEFEIIVINYGLKYSMDSSVYSMMKAKQKFIDQVLMGENVTEEFDDPMSAESNSFALMAAESMGDENLKRRVILDGELNKLTALRGAHMREAHNRENTLERAKREVRDNTARDANGIREEGKKIAGLFGRRTRTVKTTEGALAKIDGREISEEDAKKPAERQVEAALYEFGDEEIDTGKPEGKITAPLNTFIADAMVDAQGSSGVIQRDIKVNGERFVLAIKAQKYSGAYSYSAHIAWPGKVAGRVVFESYVNVGGESPAQSLLDGLRGITKPDYAERYAANIEAQIKQAEQTIKAVQPLVDNPRPFADEQEWREKSRELIEVNRLLAQANSDPRKHRYYRSLSKMVGVDATEHILGISGKPGLPSIAPDVWNRMHIRFRLARRDVPNTKEAISKRLRDVVASDTAVAARDAGESPVAGTAPVPVTAEMIENLRQKLTPNGFLFDSVRYRKRDGRLATLRRLSEKMDAKLESLQDVSLVGLSDNDKDAALDRVTQAETALKKINAEIAAIEKAKYQESMRGETSALRAAPLSSTSPEWLAMTPDERTAYLKARGIDSLPDAVEKSLTAAEKQEAADILGDKTWTAATAKAFSKRMADWMVSASEASARLTSLFRKVLNTARKTALSIAVAISVTQATSPNAQAISVQSVVQEITVPAPVIAPKLAPAARPASPPRPAPAAPSVKRADFRGKAVSSDTRTMAGWVMKSGDNASLPFAIADKKSGMISFFDGDGNLAITSPALFGRAPGDLLTAKQLAKPIEESRLDPSGHITPAGRFEADYNYDSDYGAKIDFLKKKNSVIAIHRVFTGRPAENRPGRLSSKSPVDNRISLGCINVPDSVADSAIPAFKSGGVVYVLPETPEGKSIFEGFKGLKAAPLSDSETPENIRRLTAKGRATMADAETEAEARKQQAEFADQGKVVGDPLLANPGESEESRNEWDVATQLYRLEQIRQSEAAWKAEGTRRVNAAPDAVAEKLLDDAFGEDGSGMRASDYVAARILIERRTKSAGSDQQAHADNFVLQYAYRTSRGELARAMRSGVDWFQTPAERHRDHLAGTIYSLPPKVLKQIEAKNWTPAQKREAIRRAGLKRIQEIEKVFKGLGITIEEVVGGQVFLSLSQTAVMKDALSRLSPAERAAIKAIQKGATVADVRRKTGLPDAKIQELATRVRKELADKLRAKVAAGMKLEDLTDDLKGLRAASLSAADIEAELERILTIGFGLPREVPTARLPKKRAVTQPDDENDPNAAAKRVARRWIDRLATSQSDTLAWKDKVKMSKLEALIREHLKKPVPDFIEKATALGATAEQARVLDGEASTERQRAEMIRQWRKDNPKPRKAKPTVVSADWNRPEFADELASYTFDAEGRSEIMHKVIALRNLVSAGGKIETLTGKKKVEAIAIIDQMNKLLAKDGMTVAKVLANIANKDDYRFDISDWVHVQILARMISAIDADFLDKGSEFYYASILSGLQTMMVNATAIGFGAWEATIGRAVELAVNSIARDPASAQFGEVKYILKAAGPWLSRAASNFAASWASETPFFEEDILGRAPEIGKAMEGRSLYKTGSIGGKVGKFIRTPMRILLATDDFVKTAIACTEVGAMAYRLGVASGLKPGTKEFDSFMKKQVNIPGSLAWTKAATKAAERTFTQSLPTQHDPITEQRVPIRGIGDVVGAGAAKLTEFVSMDTDNMAAKAGLLALRLLFFPFQRVPFNIVRQGARRMLNPISAVDIAYLFASNSITRNKDGKVTWKWNAGGQNAEVVERLAQQAQGGLLLLLLLATGIGEGDDDDLEKTILITGSRPFRGMNKGDREAAYDAGLGPYRISMKLPNGNRIGFNYGRIEPAATVLGSTIDTMREMGFAKDGKQSYGEAASKVAMALTSQLTEKTFLRGFSDAQQIVNGESDMNRFAAERLAVLIAPNLIRQVVRETDPVFREKPDDFIEALSYAVWPHGQLPAKRDLYGEVQEKEGNSFSRVFDFTDAGLTEQSPYSEMLRRWRLKDPKNDADQSTPQSAGNRYTPKGAKKPVEMTPPQTAEFKRVAGLRTLVRLKATPLNLTNPTEYDIKRFKDAVDSGREDARKILFNSPAWQNLK